MVRPPYAAQTHVSCLTVALFDQLCRRAAELGLAVRGAFHPQAGEIDALPPGSARTVVLLGFTGSRQWPQFAQAAEADDGLPDPLDRWSRRMIGMLAREFAAQDVYPSGTAAAPLPFQRLALRSEPVHRSPIGLLIHERFGLWHAYRGALLLEAALDLPPERESRGHPCATCEAKPCLGSCPVGAFRPAGFDLEACVDHVVSEAGRECRDSGCLARRACPVGTEFRYEAEHARFHMQAFVRSVRGSRQAGGP
jgi:hypothetical protein